MATPRTSSPCALLGSPAARGRGRHGVLEPARRACGSSALLDDRADAVSMHARSCGPALSSDGSRAATSRGRGPRAPRRSSSTETSRRRAARASPHVAGEGPALLDAAPRARADADPLAPRDSPIDARPAYGASARREHAVAEIGADRAQPPARTDARGEGMEPPRELRLDARRHGTRRPARTVWRSTTSIVARSPGPGPTSTLPLWRSPWEIPRSCSARIQRAARTSRARAFAAGCARSAGSNVSRAGRKRVARRRLLEREAPAPLDERERLGRGDARAARGSARRPLRLAPGSRAPPPARRSASPRGRWTLSSTRARARRPRRARRRGRDSRGSAARARRRPRDRAADGRATGPSAAVGGDDRESLRLEPPERHARGRRPAARTRRALPDLRVLQEHVVRREPRDHEPGAPVEESAAQHVHAEEAPRRMEEHRGAGSRGRRAASSRARRSS